MKGIARIIEAIIASIIIMTSLSFFLAPATKQNAWDASFSEIKSQDAVSSAYENGSLSFFVRTNNATGLRNILESLLGKSTDFSIEIRGIPNPFIYLGCTCSASELNDLKNKIAPLNFTYKGRNIEILLDQRSAENPGNSNIMLFLSADNLERNYTDPYTKNTIEKFLENGGTLMLIDDINEAKSHYSVITNIFNLQWSTQEANKAIGRFHEPSNASRISFNIAKYYSNLTGKNPVTETFSFHTIVNNITVDNSTVIEDFGQKFSFLKCNKNVIKDNGRAVWIADNDDGSIDNLTKAAIIWASGEKYNMDPSGPKKIPKMSRDTNMILYDNDPYEFRLTSWSVF